MRAQWEEKLAAYVKTSFAGDDAGRGRAARDPICQQADDGGAAAVRRQGGDRRRADRRRARRLQHDRRRRRCSRSCACRRSGRISSRCRSRSIASATFSTRRPSRRRSRALAPPTPRGAIELRHVDVPLPAGRAGRAEGRFARRSRPGESIGVVGPSGSGKSTLTKLDPAPLSAERRAGPARRRGPEPGRSGLAAPPHRRRAAGEPAVQPHRSREHRLRQSGDAARASDRDGAPRRRRRVHRQARPRATTR